MVLVVRGSRGVRATGAAEAMLPQLRGALRAEDAMRSCAMPLTSTLFGCFSAWLRPDSFPASCSI